MKLPIIRYVVVAIALGFSTCLSALPIRAEFTATKGTDVVRGFFEWTASNPVFHTAGDGAGNGKTLWRISGGISLNDPTSFYTMTDVTLEVMDNWFIDAPIPNSMLGDQYTLFGVAPPGSGLQSVQNFYFRDESSLLLSSIAQPTTQGQFDAFVDRRADLFIAGRPFIDTFALTEWRVISNDPITVPEPHSVALLVLAGIIFSASRVPLSRFSRR